MDSKNPKDWALELQNQLREGIINADQFEKMMLKQANLRNAAGDLYEALKGVWLEIDRSQLSNETFVKIQIAFAKVEGTIK